MTSKRTERESVCEHLSKCPFQVRNISLFFTELCMYVMPLEATQAELNSYSQYLQYEYGK